MRLPSNAWWDGLAFATAGITAGYLIRERHYFLAVISIACALYWLQKEVRGQR